MYVSFFCRFFFLPSIPTPTPPPPSSICWQFVTRRDLGGEGGVWVIICTCGYKGKSFIFFEQVQQRSSRGYAVSSRGLRARCWCLFLVLRVPSIRGAVGQHAGQEERCGFTMLRCPGRGLEFGAAALSTICALVFFYTFSVCMSVCVRACVCWRVCARATATAEITVSVQLCVFDSYRKSPLTPSDAPVPPPPPPPSAVSRSRRFSTPPPTPTPSIEPSLKLLFIY